jgi:threonine synthase
VVVAPLASGSLYTKLGKGFGELATVGLIDARAAQHFIGGQALGCGPIAAGFADGTDEVRPVEQPNTIVRSLAIGNPADGRFALQLAHKSDGGIYGIPDDRTIAAIRLLAETEGILTETAGGVTLGALQAALAAGTVKPTDEVVLVITGNGLKTMDAIVDGLAIPDPIAPTFDAFEAWWGDREAELAA